MCVFLILMIYSTEFRPIVFVRTQIMCYYPMKIRGRCISLLIRWNCIANKMMQRLVIKSQGLFRYKLRLTEKKNQKEETNQTSLNCSDFNRSQCKHRDFQTFLSAKTFLPKEFYL